MLKYLVFVGVVLQLIGVFSYAKDVVKGKAKPNRVTWLMWSIAPLIATAAGLFSGVGLAVIPVFMSGFGPLIIFILSFTNNGGLDNPSSTNIKGSTGLDSYHFWLLTHEGTITDYEKWLKQPATEAAEIVDSLIDELQQYFPIQQTENIDSSKDKASEFIKTLESETETILRLKSMPRIFSISSAKYTVP